MEAVLHGAAHLVASAASGVVGAAAHAAPVAKYVAGTAGGVGMAAGGVGMALGAYNRDNYMFDKELRFERFCTQREYACAQTNMYRRDLRKLTELTTKKMSLWCVTASLVMALDIALFCAGRLGLHGHSPPGWIEGLWLTNNAASFCFMALTIWLAMHANFRSQAASVHLLTRKVRLPVPTLKELDQARRLGSEFEQQDWSDIFRMPFIQKTGVPADNMPGDISPRHANRYGRSSLQKPSSWIRNEWELDRAGTITTGPAGDGEVVPPDTAPEHFRLYAAAQKEWWPYDVYARISMGYGFLTFIHGLGFYSLGHINIEVRAFWVAYGCAFVLMVLHALILNFDIRQGRHPEKEMLPHCQWLGPLSVFPAAIAMSLDFRVEFNEAAIIICYLLQFLSYGMIFVYQLRLLEVILPDEFHREDRDEENVGFQWWPDSWKVPTAFTHVLYLVAPPKKLSPGQYDIVREVKTGTGGLEVSVPSKKGYSSQEIADQAKYLEELFDWAQQQAVFDRLSSDGQAMVRNLHQTYTQAEQKAGGPKGRKGSEFTRTVKECIGGIDALMTQEGITPQGLSSCGASEAPSSPPPTPRSDGAGEDGFGQPKMFAGSKAVPHLGMAHVEPWKLVAFITASMAVGWVIMILGTFLEVFIGEQGLVTSPHWSRPPMTRASVSPHELGTPYGFTDPAGSRPFLPEQYAWHEEKHGADVVLIGAAAGYPGIKRRLQQNESDRALGAAVSLHDLFHALPVEIAEVTIDMLHRAPTQADAAALYMVLADAAEGIKAAGDVAAASGMAPLLEHIFWPALFEPTLLACGPARQVAAISPRGFGAASQLGSATSRFAEAFRLSGLSHLPPLVGASWHGPDLGEDKEGLLLVSRAGDLLACPGSRPGVGGSWPCAPFVGASKLPTSSGPSTHMAAAAASWLLMANGQPRLHAAIVDTNMPDLVALYTMEEVGTWVPLGEVPVPETVGKADQRHLSLAFSPSGELLLGTEDGVLTRRRLVDGAFMQAGPHVGAFSPGAEWQGACALEGSGEAHLLLRKQGGAALWTPEVHVAPVLVRASHLDIEPIVLQ